MSIPNFHPVPVRYDAPRALYADFVTRSLAANFNDETKMAALGGIAGSENRLMIISFYERTKTLLAEAEQYIYVFSSSAGDIDRIEMLHERLSEAGETVFILRERRGERASELINSDRDLEKANFHRNMDELSTAITMAKYQQHIMSILLCPQQTFSFQRF